MKKPKAKKVKRSILTLPLEGAILVQLDKVKELSNETTSNGAARFAINSLPEYIARVEKQDREIEKMQQWLDLKDEAVATIMDRIKILTKTKK